MKDLHNNKYYNANYNANMRTFYILVCIFIFRLICYYYDIDILNIFFY